MEHKNFYEYSLSELEELLISLGHKKFRAQQLFRWVYGLGVSDFSQMLNLSKQFRSELPHLFKFETPEVTQHLISQDGTMKFLFDVGDGQSVEAVMIPSKDRRTLCVSSEVGCNLACKFCYTGKQKLKRRLTAGEIIGQFLEVSKRMPEGERLTNIVFMGMGEPLDNPTAVFKSIDILHSPWGINFSRKKITVSTSGIVPMIPLITKSGTRLAVSLNAADDKTRDEIMPINKRWPIKQLLDACFEHYQVTKDRVTIEYVLLKGVTDSLEDAEKLYRLTRRIPCKINIIPFNEHPGSGYHRPNEQQVERFHQRLMQLGAHVLRRKTMGRDIYAACGQLTSAKKSNPIELQNI